MRSVRPLSFKKRLNTTSADSVHSFSIIPHGEVHCNIAARLSFAALSSVVFNPFPVLKYTLILVVRGQHRRIGFAERSSQV